jgi:hypothetical protein
MEKLAPKAVSICFVMECPTLSSFVSRLVVLYSVFVIDIGFPFDLTNDGHGLRKLPGSALISVRRQCVFLNTSKSWVTFSVGTCSSYNETLREGRERRKLWSDLEHSPIHHPPQLHISDWLLFQY